MRTLQGLATAHVFAICMQAPNSATSTAATSTGVFLGQQPYGGFNGSSNQAPQLYAQQLQGKPPCWQGLSLLCAQGITLVSAA